MVSSVFVVGNWKMNGSATLAEGFCQEIQKIGSALADEVKVALCVPDTLLSAFSASSQIRVGAQNVSEFDSGAYTGETSATLLKEQGCNLVIVGHSERRQLFGETSAQVAKKAAKAVQMGLTPIVCIGETEEQRQEDKTFNVLAEQLQPVLDGLSKEEVASIWVAYEPVWAIGTGKTASPEQAQEVHSWLRSALGAAGTDIPLLYGGSVKAGNAEQLFQQKDIDGGLIGGASLDIDEFSSICRSADALIKQKAK